MSKHSLSYHIYLFSLASLVASLIAIGMKATGPAIVLGLTFALSVYFGVSLNRPGKRQPSVVTGPAPGRGGSGGNAMHRCPFHREVVTYCECRGVCLDNGEELIASSKKPGQAGRISIYVKS